MSADKDKDV